MLNNKGFTLIELLVVIAIIGILVSIVVVAIDPVAVIGRANDSKKREELSQVKNALQLYFNDHNRYPIDSDDEFSVSCAVTCLSPDFMRQVPSSAVYADDTVAGVPSGEYRAAEVLAKPNTSDGDTLVKCGGASQHPSGWSTTYDYFICPD